MKFLAILAFTFLLLLGLYLVTRPSEAEYNSCLITMTDKSICESLNPQKWTHDLI